MTFRKALLLLFLAIELLGAVPLADEWKRTGYVEIDREQPAEVFDALYARFDELIDFLQTNRIWAKKLKIGKEQFIRSAEKNLYSTDFFGFYDEKRGRGQISFYYSTHFHEFMASECSKVPEIARFLDACLEIQKPYGSLFERAAAELGLEAIFSPVRRPPILLKVVKYLPSYTATRAHYDGTAFSLFLDSTDHQSLLLSPYKPSFTMDDFSPVHRAQKESILLIPGALLTEFSIYPTPHIVAPRGQVRYATVAFAMRPNYTLQKTELSPLPNFQR